MSETSWSCTSYSTCTNYGGSNGGYSTYFTRPAYQNAYQTNAYRGVPDLSSDALPSSGFLVYFSDPSYGGYNLYGGKEYFYSKKNRLF